jgi:hypothetical protein
MNAIILAAAFALGQVPAKAPEPVPTLDGNWIVVSFEKSGQTMAEAKDCMVTIKDNVIVYSPKNEKMSINAMKLEFGPQSTVQVTEIAPKTEEANPPKARPGVYILTQEYVAISIRDSAAISVGETPPVASSTKPNANAFCTVIMKRVTLPERK